MKKNEHIDWELISKSFREQLNPEEQERLEDWLAASPDHRRFYAKAQRGGETDPEVGLGQELLAQKRRELMQKIGRKAGKGRSLKVWMRYAAILVLPVALAVTLWMQLEKPGGETMQPTKIVAGAGRAVLELHDGRTYILDTVQTIETGMEGNMAHAGRKQLEYDRRDAEEVVYNKMLVPRGGEYQLKLADGSRVWLNSATKLSYPVAFPKDARVVYLTGEAYFEVAHDTTRPFIVVSDDIRVKVYGTEFNINTQREGTIQTTLVNGKVGITVSSTGVETMLKPSQMAEFSVADGTMRVEDVDTYPYTAWKDGEFVFQDETIEEILERLSLWYDVEVFYANNDVKSQRFTGIIARFSDISDVLYLIGETATVNFSIQNRTIVVK